MTRKVIFIMLALFSALSLGLAAHALLNKQWETVTASLSLVIAIISAWVAYEAFHRQDESRQAQITLSIDPDSRYSLIQLICKNSGELPAFNVEIHWNNNLINYYKQPTRFNYSGVGPEILVLNSKEVASTWVTTDEELYDETNNFDMDYSGTVSFQNSLQSSKRILQPFHFSVRHTKDSLSAKKEDLLTMVELQKLPKSIDAMTKEIYLLRQMIHQKKGDNS